MATVGIFSRCSIDTYRWLLQFLYTFLSEDNVRPVEITNHSALLISRITFAILYHSKTRGRVNVTDVTDSLYDSELRELSRVLGVNNVIVVIDDLEDNSDQAKHRILENQPSIRRLARDLFLFNAQAKQDGDINLNNVYNKFRIKEMITEQSMSCLRCCCYSSSSGSSYEMSASRIWLLGMIAAVLCLYILVVYWYNCNVLLWSWFPGGDNHFHLRLSSLPTVVMFPWSRVSVRIFSRDDESSYQWLTSYLSTIRYVLSIQSVYVTNNGMERFKKGTRKCTFAILYHTKRRGRVNITDVTDSLYDDELGYLSSVKGKENVIVVIDDLDDDGNNGNGHRTRILKNQPSLQRLVREVFCFTLSEKHALVQNCPAPGTLAKLKKMEKMIEGQAWWKSWRQIFIVSVVAIILGGGFIWMRKQ
ncbi:uncharacterized protein RB166_016081 [Leptodactylus fuscus]